MAIAEKASLDNANIRDTFSLQQIDVSLLALDNKKQYLTELGRLQLRYQRSRAAIFYCHGISKIRKQSSRSTTPSSEMGPSPSARIEEEEEGEELMDETLMREDYKAIPELDTYERTGIDEEEYDAISPSARQQVEREMAARDAKERRRGRVPAALMTPTDDEGEERPARRRRITAEQEGEAEGDELSGGERGMESEPEEEEEKVVRMESYQGTSLKEWVQRDASQKEIKRRFRHFLTEFRDGEGEHSYYMPQIRRMCDTNQQSLLISYLHLSQATPNLAVWVADEPSSILKLFGEEAMTIALTMYPHYKSVTKDIHVRITQIPIVDSLRDLRHAHLNALIKVEGVVTRRTAVFPQLKQIKFRCVKCEALLGPFIQRDTELKIQRCAECQSEGPFRIDMEHTIYQNYQKITLQESPGSVPAGRVPRQKDVILLHDLIDQVSPGEEISPTLNAINCFPVFNTLLEANFVTKKSESISNMQLTDDEIKSFERMAKQPNIADVIVNSIAPSIYGYRNIKMGLAMAMLSGNPKFIDAKHRIRGDINVLILGDPGCAKSQFLKYTEKTAYRAVYTTGKGASAVGLTAAVRPDPLTREWTLEGGALVLADNGVCLIDEFDKMTEKDRTSIHEAMEQQTISISKAGIVCTLKARCSVIAAANPIRGRYDSQATFAENVDLTEAILSRFDILFVVRDTIDRDADARLAGFVVDSHVNAHPHNSDTGKEDVRTETADGERLDQETLRKYLYYAKLTKKPKLGGIDQDKLSELYQELRRESAVTGGIPIAVRHIESLIRMAEAHAKMHLRDNVTEDDVNMAIKIMLDSFINSQKYQVKKSLEQHFSKYISYKESHFELLLYTLQNLIKEQEMFRTFQGRDFMPGEDVSVSLDDFQARAAELQIHNVVPFYKSKLFSKNGFRVDMNAKPPVITKAYQEAAYVTNRALIDAKQIEKFQAVYSLYSYFKTWRSCVRQDYSDNNRACLMLVQ
eukprot:g2105.t1